MIYIMFFLFSEIQIFGGTIGFIMISKGKSWVPGLCNSLSKSCILSWWIGYYLNF